MSSSQDFPARKYHQHVPDLSGLVSLNFREELHAIDSCCFGPGNRDLQRLAGGSRTCERGPCEANERDDAGLRLLHRAPRKPSEDGVDQSLRSLGMEAR